MRITWLLISTMTAIVLTGCARPVQTPSPVAPIQKSADARTLFLGVGAPDSPALEVRRDASLSMRAHATEFERDAWNLARPGDVRQPMRIRMSVESSTYMFFAPRHRGLSCDR